MRTENLEEGGWGEAGRNGTSVKCIEWKNADFVQALILFSSIRYFFQLKSYTNLRTLPAKKPSFGLSTPLSFSMECELE